MFERDAGALLDGWGACPDSVAAHVERLFGALDRMYRFHRRLGEAVGALLVAHVALIAGSPPVHRLAVVATGAVLSLAALGIVEAPAAEAHDPGQGTEARPASLRAERVGDDRVSVTLTVRDGRCVGFTAVRTVARRAGGSRAGSLRPDGRCRWRGEVAAAGDGRSFIYVELDDRGRQLELWVPLARDERAAAVDRRLYAPPARSSRRLQAAAGVGLYLLVGALLVLTTRTSRRLAESDGGVRQGHRSVSR